MTRGVYYIYLGVAVPYGGVLGHDGDAALTLKVIGVHYAVHDLLIFAVYAGLLEHFVDQSGLAVVNVGNDCYVSEFVHLSQLPCVRFVSDFIFNTKLNFNTSETKNQHKSAIFAEISGNFYPPRPTRLKNAGAGIIIKKKSQERAMSDNFFAYISRMRYIVRWSLMRNSLPENIQEHSHMVAVIAHALGVIRRDVMGVPCDPNEAAVVALFHDSSEILTGDLPTPIKYHSEEIKGAYRQVENLACNMLLDTLPDELRGAYEPLLTGETQERLHDIVKAADKLSAYIKCIEERKAGNNEFLSAEKQNREQLEANPLPEVKYFMEHFIPAFELTLDELGTIG